MTGLGQLCAFGTARHRVCYAAMNRRLQRPRHARLGAFRWSGSPERRWASVGRYGGYQLGENGAAPRYRGDTIWGGTNVSRLKGNDESSLQR